jgi:hypothetical protein
MADTTTISPLRQRLIDDMTTRRLSPKTQWALGGHVDACGDLRISYNSCDNELCPKCQCAASSPWPEGQDAALVPVHYLPCGHYHHHRSLKLSSR